jgi:polysaccharide export outer membrane protein
MFLDNRMEADMMVAGGDVIYIHRQPLFYIYGEIASPGSKRVERDMTIRQALAHSGGPTVQRGTAQGLHLYRRDAQGKIQSLTPDLNERVQPDDVLYVNANMFYIYGYVQRPGFYHIEPGMTVRQALAQGGGPTERGTERGLRLYRRGADSRVESKGPDLGDAVLPGDVLYVDSSLF